MSKVCNWNLEKKYTVQPRQATQSLRTSAASSIRWDITSCLVGPVILRKKLNEDESLVHSLAHRQFIYVCEVKKGQLLYLLFQLPSSTELIINDRNVFYTINWQRYANHIQKLAWLQFLNIL
jgi:hypothetical protein